MKRLLITLCILLVGISAWATDYNVNSSATFKTALAAAQPGDNIILANGTYQDTSASSNLAFNLARSGTSGNPITIKALNALGAVLQGNSNSVPALSVNGVDYVVVDGLRVIGGIDFHNTDYSTLKNCEITYGYLDQGEVSLYQGFLMRFSNYCLIQNNYVHDISVPSDHYHNGGCFMVNGLAGTNTNYNIFEYNTADGGTTLCYNAFGGKGGNYNDCTWRYNLAINCIGPLVMAMGSTDGATGVYRGKVHNNVAVNCGALFEDYRHGHDFEVYNNSFYGKTSSYVFNLQWERGAQMPSGLIFYNNLIQRGARNYQRDCSSCGNWPGYFSYIDYNQVYSVTYWAGGPGGLTSTLAEWKALVSSLVSGSENGDYNSSTTSPGFVNAGGSTAADYKRSSYPTDGRGGAYPSVKGAYITGSETIGYSESGSSPSTPTIRSGGVRSGGFR